MQKQSWHAKPTTAKSHETKSHEKSAAGRKEDKDIHGEGNYSAARRFREGEEKFVKRNRDNIPEMAKKAEAATKGKSGEELRKAEEQARSHSHAGHDDR